MKPDGVVLDLDTGIPGQGGPGLELCLEVFHIPKVEATVVGRLTNERWGQVQIDESMFEWYNSRIRTWLPRRLAL